MWRSQQIAYSCPDSLRQEHGPKRRLDWRIRQTPWRRPPHPRLGLGKGKVMSCDLTFQKQTRAPGMKSWPAATEAGSHFGCRTCTSLGNSNNILPAFRMPAMTSLHPLKLSRVWEGAEERGGTGGIWASEPAKEKERPGHCLPSARRVTCRREPFLPHYTRWV